MDMPQLKEPDCGILSPVLEASAALGYIVPPIVADPVLQQTIDNLAQQVNALVPIHNAQQEARKEISEGPKRVSSSPLTTAPIMRRESAPAQRRQSTMGNQNHRRDAEKENSAPPARGTVVPNAGLGFHEVPPRAIPLRRVKLDDEMPGAYHSITRGASPQIPFKLVASLLSQEPASAESSLTPELSNSPWITQTPNLGGGGKRKSKGELAVLLPLCSSDTFSQSPAVQRFGRPTTAVFLLLLLPSPRVSATRSPSFAAGSQIYSTSGSHSRCTCTRGRTTSSRRTARSRESWRISVSA